jgi:hypothetical protein
MTPTRTTGRGPLAHDLLKDGTLSRQALRIYGDVSRHRVTTSDGQELAERIDEPDAFKTT